jgi:hypothetical protein
MLEALEASPYISDGLLFTLPSSAVAEEVPTARLSHRAQTGARAHGDVRAAHRNMAQRIPPRCSG